MKTRHPHNRMKAKTIPQVVVNLVVKYADHRGTVIIPCYSFAECMQHEMYLNGVAKTERRKV